MDTGMAKKYQHASVYRRSDVMQQRDEFWVNRVAGQQPILTWPRDRVTVSVANGTGTSPLAGASPTELNLSPNLGLQESGSLLPARAPHRTTRLGHAPGVEEFGKLLVR